MEPRRSDTRRIARWRVCWTAHADFVPDAFVPDASEQVLNGVVPIKVAKSVHPCGRGSQHLSICYTERLAEAGVDPSVCGVGHSYDDAPAETINGLSKAAVIHRHGLDLGRRGRLDGREA